MSISRDGRRIYNLCRRCGRDVEPAVGQPRTCRDCYEVEHTRADLYPDGADLTPRQVEHVLAYAAAHPDSRIDLQVVAS